MAYRLGIDESVEFAVRRIAHEQIRGALRDLGGDSSDRSTGVHDARKRCKKLRSLLRLVDSAMGDAFAVEDAEIRNAARRLSAMRDAHVMLSTIKTLQQERRNDAGAAAILDQLGVRPTQDQSKGGAAQVDESNDAVDRFIADIQLVQARVDQWRLQASEMDWIAPGLVRTYRRARRSMKIAMALPSPMNLHEWRKHAKHHQYHVRLLVNLWPRIMQARYDETKALTDAMGEDHDLALLREALCATATASTQIGDESAVLAVIDRRRAELQAYAFPLGRRLFSEKPRWHGRRMSRLWKLWREKLRPEDLNRMAEPDSQSTPEVHTIATDDAAFSDRLASDVA